MKDSVNSPPLKSLHAGSSLNRSKLATIDTASTQDLIASLKPGLDNCLKTRPDGTILEEHHRIFILRQRGVDVDQLPREVIVKDDADDVDKNFLG